MKRESKCDDWVNLKRYVIETWIMIEIKGS